MSHTPGPWVAVGKAFGTHGDDTIYGSPVQSNLRICFLDETRIGSGIDGDEYQANGRLIAAAPELLAVCEKLAARGAVIATTGLGDELLAAIAKAKGGA